MLELLDVSPANRKAASSAAPADSDFWSALASVGDAEAFGRSWLVLASRSFEPLVQSALLIGAADTGPFRPIARWSRERASGEADAFEGYESVLQAAIERRQPAFEGLTTGDGAEGERALIGFPLMVADALHGVVIAEARELGRKEAKRLARHLQWSAGWFEAFVRRRSQRDAHSLGRTAETMVHVIGAVVAEARLSDAARVLAGAVEQRFGCDQVAVTRTINHRSRVIALGQTASFEWRSQAARRLAAAADEAIDQRTALLAPPPDDFHYVTTSQEALSRASGNAHVLTLPISTADETFGALVMLRGASAFSQEDVDLLDALGSSAGAILAEKARHDRSLPALAAARGLGLLRGLLGRGHFVLKVATLAVIAAAGVLAFAESEYRVRARAEVQGEVRRALSAPFDGYIKSAQARAGDVVPAGATLAELQDNDLVLERLRQLARKRQYQSELDKALAKRDLAGTNIAEAQVGQASAEIELSDQMLARAKLVTPFASVIVSGDLSQSIGRPVSRGDTLFEIAPLDRYRVTLVVPDADIRLITPDMKGEILLSALPERPLAFEIKSITPVARAAEGVNGFEAIGVLVDRDERIRPGMAGVAKIDAGRRSLFWIWTHAFFEWVRVKTWELVP